MKDIAQALGVSVATVSFALNGSTLISEPVRKRVREKADELGYIPNMAAQNLSFQKSRQIGLLIPDIENVFYASVVRHINDCVHAHGMELLIVLTGNNPEDERRGIESLIRSRVRGVILVPVSCPDSENGTLELMRQNDIPYVFCTDYYSFAPKEDIHIMADFKAGMSGLIQYAAERGCRSILYLTGQPGAVSLDMREDGMRAAAKENGIEVELVRLKKVDAEETEKYLKERLLGKGISADAVICTNDMMALSCVNILRAAEKRIPEDIRVAGFDNEIFSSLSAIPITSVDQNLAEISGQSVESLFDMFENKAPRSKYIKPKLIKRISL